MKKPLFVCFLLFSLSSAPLAADAAFRFRATLPNGGLGVEYSASEFFVQAGIGGIVPGFLAMTSFSASGGYDLPLGEHLHFRPIANFHVVRHATLNSPILSVPSYYSFNAGLGTELRWQFHPRWSLTFSLPLAGLHWDDHGLPLSLFYYYIDSLAAQALVSLDLRI